ncbi:MAG: hypothetical protein E7290_14105 [Lachnospiraceae bacterium]|nr:hypothetical protein [Lachnospiraceae bacterium]
MRINYNISSIIARNALNVNNTRLSNSIERLSSGLKINHASDDAAGLAISVKMNAQIRSLEQANRNANDGISVVNTADGAMQEAHAILQRMNELAVQSANGTNSDGDREQIQLEIDQLVQELDRIAETTQFNEQNLLDGTFAYKGYTNSENVKVMSYSDGVSSGIYVMNKLEYNYYEDTIKDKDAYLYNGANAEVTHEERYQALSADTIKADLDYDVEEGSGYKSFPEGAKVVLDEENVIIQAENDFQVKITMNNRSEIAGSGATTTTKEFMIKTDSFQNITVIDEATNAKYNISRLDFITETDATGAVVREEINTGSEALGLRGLEEDFKELFARKYDNQDVEVTDCRFNATTNEFSIDVEVEDGTQETLTYKVFVPEDNEEVLPAGYDDRYHYLHSHTDTEKTTYTIGDDDPDNNNLELDLTGIGAMRLQVGANEGQVIAIEIPALNPVYLGVDKLDITTEEKATAAIDTIGAAINQLSTIRSKIGAYANRIEHTITNLDTTTENMTAAYSRIMDVDMATEMTEYSTVQVLVESSTAMLAQANERPQSVLQLLQ